jgi:uncharacterized protein YijF (DUF1287 family)
MRPTFLVTAIFSICISAGCHGGGSMEKQFGGGPFSSTDFERPPISEIAPDTVRQIIVSAKEQLTVTTGYTQEYRVIPYPGGDLPPETGACTDVLIRAFRKAGVDLQKEVHEDMATSFSSYPQRWGLTSTDTNIDHRRVPNIQTFFVRKGKAMSISRGGDNYRPGDVVTWDLDGKGMTHIGLVSNVWNDREKRYLIIHNIGGGVAEEDRLFAWKIIGHYRYF